jgi:hypothetical protein
MTRTLIAAAALVLCACTQREPDPWSIETHCSIVSKQDTGWRDYCGKACSQPVYRYTYHCPSSVVLEAH